MRRGPYGSALATGRLAAELVDQDRAAQLKRPKHCSTSPERPLEQARWSFVGFACLRRDPLLAERFMLLAVVLERL